MNNVNATPIRSRAWFPGRLVPLRRLAAIEVLPTGRRVLLRVGKDTVQGSARGVLALGVQAVQAALKEDPELATVLPDGFRALLAAV